MKLKKTTITLITTTLLIISSLFVSPTLQAETKIKENELIDNHIYNADLTPEWTSGYTANGIFYILVNGIYYFQPKWATGPLKAVWQGIVTTALIDISVINTIIGSLPNTDVTFDDVIGETMSKIRTGWDSLKARYSDGSLEPKSITLLKKLLGVGELINDMANTASDSIDTIIDNIDKSVSAHSAKSYYNTYDRVGTLYNYYQGDTNYYPVYNDSTQKIFNTITNDYYNVISTTYDYVNNTYNYYISDQEHYSVKNYANYTNVIAVTDNDSVEYNLYFKLPNGSNSYNLTADQIYGIPTDFNVSTYNATFDYENLIGLYHFNGNNYNSAYGTLTSPVKPNSIQFVNTNSIFDTGIYFNNPNVSIDLSSYNYDELTLSLRFMPSYNTTFSMKLGDLDLAGKTTTTDYTYTTKTNTTTTTNQQLIYYTFTLTNTTSNYSCSNVTYPSGCRCSVTHEALGSGKYEHRFYINSDTNYNSAPKTESRTTNTTYFEHESLLDVVTGFSNSINYDSWNYLDIEKNNDTYSIYLNGEYIDDYESDEFNLIFNQNGYLILDELVIENGINVNRQNVSYIPVSSNKVYTLPDNIDSNNLILIQSTIPVTKWQMGGLRPSRSNHGDVYFSLDENGIITDVQQYQYADWIKVNGALFSTKLNKWVDIVGYSTRLLNFTYQDLDQSFSTTTLDDVNTNLDDIKSLLANGINVDVSTNSGTIDLIGEYDIDVDNTISGYLDSVKTIDGTINFNFDNSLGDDLLAVKSLATQTNTIFDVIHENDLDILYIAPLILFIIRLVI